MAKNRDSEQIEACKVKGRDCPEFRVSYPHLFTPGEAMEGQEQGKYGLTMLFDKRRADLKPLIRAARAAAEQEWGPGYEKKHKIRWPFRDGDKDRPGTEGYENVTFVGANCKKKPKTFNEEVEPASEGEIYAGCYGRATVIAFAYEFMKKKGVSFALLSFQKTRDGTQIGGYDASGDFDASPRGASDDDDAKESDDMFI